MAKKDTRKNGPRVWDWQRRNPEMFKAQRRRLYERRISFVREAKSVPCTDCGKTFPYYVMQFDHVEGEKKFTIGGGGVMCHGLDALIEEIVKCDVVCANCHCIRSFAKAHWLKRKKAI